MVDQSMALLRQITLLLICVVVVPLTFAHPTDSAHLPDRTCDTTVDTSDDDSLSSSCASDVQSEDVHAGSPVTAGSMIYERLRRERAVENVRSILTGHKRNYVLPFSYNRSSNQMPFTGPTGIELNGGSLHRSEVKFQLSLKSSIWRPGIVSEDAYTSALPQRRGGRLSTNRPRHPFAKRITNLKSSG
ncbi:MAG: hypothetical protein CNE99_03490 [OM182 bacterium MED-G24]|uniref:Phospholipase A1 n=1 Tax=OM182 bacterium MED-G24 TaxID=1986255 RepID=A0A2A5WVD7_9GAMM|nr:MAG: hypothetical protein CNE99_03490 [OM182 bacterium MED-G24]